MPNGEAGDTFTRLADGTTLVRQTDGSYLPVKSETDYAELAALSDAEIERIAATDPDHPALDETFWVGIEERPSQEAAISIKIDGDILTYFRRQGRGYQTRINAVLRRYVDAHREKRG